MQKSETELKNGWSSYPVDVWNQQRPPDRIGDLGFWTCCVETYGSPVLDLCCGNGRISIALAQRGYRVVGVDINARFIAAARQRAACLGRTDNALDVSFILTDIVHLDLQEKFKVDIMPDWSAHAEGSDIVSQSPARRAAAGWHIHLHVPAEGEER